MAAPKLIATVYITDEDGEIHKFGPGDTVPAELLPKASNPKLWDGGKVPTGTAATDDGGEPPRNGAGSGRDAWAAYAESISVAVEDDATRDEIIAAVDAHND